jgi:hypothetical protein
LILTAVIQQCDAFNPRCACTFCTSNFHCPTCYSKSAVKAQCRLEAENLAKKEEAERAERIKIKDLEDRGQADEVAASVFEFFTSLYETLPPDLAMDTVALMSMGSSENGQEEGSGNGLLLPSPDSITVTTEFGVSEEQGNVTIITTVPSLFAEPDSPSTVNHEPGMEQGVEMGTIEDLNQNMLQLGIGSAIPDNSAEGQDADPNTVELSIEIPQTPMETLATVDVVVETDEETVADDQANNANDETDDFGSMDGDAGGVALEESVDEGTNTPTTPVISATA